MPGSALPPIDWVQLVSSFLLVIGLLALALVWMKRLQRVAPGKGRRIQVIEAHATGPRQKMILVRVQDREVLVGVSPGRMDALGEWAAAFETPEAPHLNDPPSVTPFSSTQEKLARFLNKRRA